MTAQERWREAARGTSELYRAADTPNATVAYWGLLVAIEAFRRAECFTLAEQVEELADGFAFDDAQLREIISNAAAECARLETEVLSND